jgi:hypothetical protein
MSIALCSTRQQGVEPLRSASGLGDQRFLAHSGLNPRLNACSGQIEPHDASYTVLRHTIDGQAAVRIVTFEDG